MNLADRANLYFKIGNFVDVPIDDGEEMEIIKMISSAETFADAVLAAEELYKYVKVKHRITIMRKSNLLLKILLRVTLIKK